MIPFNEALGLVLAEAPLRPPEEAAPLACLGRVCASTVLSPVDLPAWDRSLMDGFAVRSDETASASHASPVRLKVVADLPAGRSYQGKVGRGECVRIMTGAPIPCGCDAVVMREDAADEGGGVLIKAPVAAGRNVRRKGGDLGKGDAVVPAGKRVGPADICALVSAMIPFVSVFRRPVVAILSTGDELVDAGAAVFRSPVPGGVWKPEGAGAVLGPGKIPASNNAALEAQVLEAGAVPLRLGVAKDRVEDIVAAVRKAAGADVVLTVGGTGDGSHDLARDALGRMGFETRFERVAMKPGKSLIFGKLGKALAFGLPGSPAAAMLCFDLLVRPALLKMMGRPDIFRRSVKAKSVSEAGKEPGVRRFLRGSCRREEGGYVFSTGDAGDGVLASLAKANGIAVLDERAGPLKKGDAVEVLLLEESL